MKYTTCADHYYRWKLYASSGAVGAKIRIQLVMQCSYRYIQCSASVINEAKNIILFIYAAIPFPRSDFTAIIRTYPPTTQ